MIFIALLLLSFRFIPNQCYKFPQIPETFPELISFLELISFDIYTDVFVEFVLEDQSLYTAYFEIQLGLIKQLPGIVAFHFNLDDIPLQALSEHVLYTDSLETLQ